MGRAWLFPIIIAAIAVTIALTLADIALGCWVHRWFALPIERPDLPNLTAYYETLKTRPGFAQHIALPLE